MKNSLNILVVHQKKIRVSILALFVLIVLTSLSVEFFRAVENDHYFVAHEDEVIYFGSAQVFATSGSLQAESCIDEDVSRIGKFNWYGPGYNAVYGSLQLVFGQSNSLFIKFHFVLALLILMLITFFPIEIEDKLLIASILLVTEQFTCYIFSYFPEILSLFFSTVLVFFLLRIYKREELRKGRILLAAYVSLVLLFSLCRVTTIFWLAALLPLGSTWRQRIPYAIIFCVGVIASVIYLRFCIAPPYASQMHKLQNLYTLNLWEFVLQTVRAMLSNAVAIISHRSIPVYMLLLLAGVAVFNFWRTKDKFFLASILVSACLIGVLMAFYTVEPFFFVKQTAMLVPLLLVTLMHGDSTKLKWSIFLLLIFFWVPVNKKRTKIIEEHHGAYTSLKNHKALHDDFQKLREVIVPHKDVVILWCYNEYGYGNAAQALLPYSTISNNPIMYTTNIIFDHTVPLEQKFKLHHKLQVDYILSRNPIEWSNLQLVVQNTNFSFYKIKK